MILVDSSVWIAHLRNEMSAAVATLRAASPRFLLVGDLILLEVLQGARDEAHAAKIEALLRAFPLVPLLGEARAVDAARLYRTLRAHGVTVRRTPDLIIAAYCLAHGHALLHQDRDFEPFARHCGLQVA